jgi:hypothetical protein
MALTIEEHVGIDADEKIAADVVGRPDQSVQPQSVGEIVRSDDDRRPEGQIRIAVEIDIARLRLGIGGGGDAASWVSSARKAHNRAPSAPTVRRITAASPRVVCSGTTRAAANAASMSRLRPGQRGLRFRSQVQACVAGLRAAGPTATPARSPAVAPTGPGS